MALPTPTPTGFVQIPNNGFEDGATGWTTVGTANIVNESAMGGSWCVKVAAAGETNDGGVISSTYFPVVPGQAVSLTASGKMTTGTPGTSFSVALYWYDGSNTLISQSTGAQVSRASVGSNQATASVGASAPANAAFVRPVGTMNTSASSTTSTIYMDNFSWNYNNGVAITLTHPISSYADDQNIPFNISASGLPSGVTVTSVSYYTMEWDGSDYVSPTLAGTVTSSPFSYEASPMTDGQYGAYALVTLSSGLVITTNSRVFLVGAVAPGDFRDYKASNAYTYLVGESFDGIAASIPTTAVVTGAELLLDYRLEVLTRAKDLEVDDPLAATGSVVFDIVNSATIEAALLNKNTNDYTAVGAPMSVQIPVSQADFVVAEEGLAADGSYKWIVYEQDATQTVIIGAEALLFGQTTMSAPDFVDKAIGLRFFPSVGSKPAYADTGDGCIRFYLDSWKLRVYFDAGSIEYYFASPGYSDVIKGELVAGNVIDGNLVNGDAEGILQLSPELEIVDGSSDVISGGWTIHSAYPVTDLNKIGVVAETMTYNALPPYYEVEDARSRYQFISANFYGDPELESIYGVNGVDRGFAYNGEDFYKIVANPEADKDKPRHVAYHHTHLALGYSEGRVDVSVVGAPWNFDGARGASSWATGDPVTGLLSLNGTLLGIYCRKSVQALSGTTVDNFATQVVSAKLGAVEYTVCDVGFPVHANAYGIYTLEQTDKYGDFIGQPMSQVVSPWLRPRLVRRSTSDKEVVVAWPVRSKNQYKLAFADGYVLTMTMNYGTQAAPTFSKQMYTLVDDAWRSVTDSDMTFDGTDNVVFYQGVVYGTAPGEISDESWTMTLDSPQTVRITVQQFTSNAQPESGSFLFMTTSGPVLVDNTGGVDEWVPSQIVQNNVTAITYMPGEQSDYSYDTYRFLVQLAVPGTTVPVVPAAISSELDDGGEERIHVANKQIVERPAIPLMTGVGSDGTVYLGLPVPAGTVVDWGDGTVDTAPGTMQMSHTYSNEAEYEWKVLDMPGSKAFNSYLYVGGTGLLEITSWPIMNEWAQANNGKGPIFGEVGSPAANLRRVPSSLPASVTNLSMCFKACNQTSSIAGVSEWNTANVTTMLGTFSYTTALQSLDLSGWDVSNVYTMEEMFAGAASLTTAGATNWDVSKVLSMKSMFGNCGSYNEDLLWTPTLCTDMSSMFYQCYAFNGDISGWDTGNVTTTASMFDTCYVFNRNLNAWNVGSVTDMQNMFARCYVFNQPLAAWDMSNCTDTRNMFTYALAFNQDISSWNVGSVVFMVDMFRNAEAFNSPLNSWDVSSVTNMHGMFEEAYAFNQDLDEWDVSNVTLMSRMFFDASSFDGNVSTWNTSNVTDMSYMFCFTLANPNLSTWDVSNVSNMRNMFYLNTAFSGDLSAWNTAALSNTTSMFQGATAFNSDLGNWKVGGVSRVNMALMFSGATTFNQDLSGWCVSSVATAPSNFSSGATAWVLPKPVWGTCPGGV